MRSGTNERLHGTCTRLVPIAAALVVASVFFAFSAASASLPASFAAAADEGPALQLTTDPPGTVHLLTPGESANWNVGVTTRAVTVDSLVGQLRASGQLASISRNATIALASCRSPWQGVTCGAGAYSVLPRTALAGLAMPVTRLTDAAQAVPPDVYLQARVALPTDAPPEVQGAAAHVRLTVSASGESTAALSEPPARIADTGSRVAGFGALAALAVITGMTLAALARRRVRAHA